MTAPGATISEPLEVEVFQYALRSIAEEMGAMLIRTARSVNIRDRHDTSCAIFDEAGNLLVQAEHHPAHLGALMSMVRHTLRRFDVDDIRDGDVFIGNDPYEGGGSHLPDVTLTAPVLSDGVLLGFVAAMGHWVDVGGRGPGASVQGSTEIYQEGIRISPLRIRRAGVLDGNLLDMLLANMRTAEDNRMDFHGQLAACDIGVGGVLELVRRYTAARYRRLGADVMAHSELALREAIRRIPEGTVSFADCVDDDGTDPSPVELVLSLRVTHRPVPHLTFDFTGSAAQRTGGVNTVKSNVSTAVAYVLKSLLAPDLAMSAGAYHVFDVVAPEGTVFNCQPPAPVGGKGALSVRTVELCLGALAQVLPEAVVAGSSFNNGYFLNWTRLDGRDAVHLEGIAGGMGARFAKDGPDAVQVHTSNMANVPVEICERIVPVRVERLELVPDSAGAGRSRGGLAVLKEFRCLSDLRFIPHGDRHKFAPWGLFGGEPGSTARYSYVRDGKETTLPSKGRAIALAAGDLLRVCSSGGGGYGDPRERPADDVAKDVREGKLSPAEAALRYGRTAR
jgi:N-methylhydantoinase B